jgi:hypothetical protein
MSGGKKYNRNRALRKALGIKPLQLHPEPERKFEAGPEPDAGNWLFPSPIEDIDLMIHNGWGNAPQSELPAEWRSFTRREWLKLRRKGHA